MKTTLAIVLVLTLAASAADLPQPWKKAVPGWTFEFPRDHVSHAGFKTEWWYFTGNLRTDAGRRFGYQLTFFRQGIRPPGSPRAKSRFVQDDLKFGHFAVTDLAGRKFLFSQSLTRGAFEEAGFGDGQKDTRLAWLGSWNLRLTPEGGFAISADEPDRALDLVLQPKKPWALHGDAGLSHKAEGGNSASYYYSATRLDARGTVRIGNERFTVTGESWFDHEWATNQLAADQVGWDWFSLQFNDGTELMLYRLRRRDGSVDPASSGSFIDREGKVHHLTNAQMQVTTTERWKSPRSGAEYPSAWKLEVPAHQITLTVRPPMNEQELVLHPVTYWEGMVDLQGNRAGAEVRGHGYVELTGYTGPIVGITAPQQ
jgi:predicted secreted hydrolase